MAALGALLLLVWITSGIQWKCGMTNKCNDPSALYFNQLMWRCHEAAVAGGWWTDLETGASLIGRRNIPELLCLVHSEISEALEGYRKNLMDDKLPHRSSMEVELADAIIRIADLAGAMGFDLGGAIVEKLHYNSLRADHKIYNRKAEGGKKF